MIERGKHLRLALEARQPLGIGREGLRQDLQRDVAIEPRIAGAIHLTHAAGTDTTDHFVRPDSHAEGDRHSQLERSKFQFTSTVRTGAVEDPVVATMNRDPSAVTSY